MGKEIYIVGAGTYGEVMYELAEELGYVVKGYYDEDLLKKNEEIMGSKILGPFSELNKKDIENKNFIVAIGNNKIRRNLMSRINKFGGLTPTLIHPSVIINKSAKIGNGVYIQANTYIWTKVNISDYCIISPSVVIAHHTNVGEGCLISTNSAIGASINIEDEVFIGMSGTIVTGVKKVGRETIVGAGAVVLKDVENKSVYAGIPAKKLKDI